MLAGAVLRWKIATSSGFWTDEAEFLFITRFPSVTELVHFLKWHESHPPLFYLMERVWLVVLGDSDTTAVALPVLLGVTLIPVTYLIGRRLFSPWVGTCAALLVAANPYLSFFSGYARPYSLLPLLATASAACLWRGLQDGNRVAWVGYVLTTSAMLFTHNWAWLVFGAEELVVTAWLLHPAGRTMRREAPGWVASTAAVFGIYSWWLPALIGQVRHAGHAARRGWTARAPLYPFTEFARVTIGYPGSIAIILIVFLIGVAAWASRRRIEGKADGARFALVVCAGMSLVSVVLAGALSARTWLTQEYCLVILSPLALLAMSRGLEVLLVRRSRGLFVTAALAITVIYLLHWPVLLNIGKSNAREIALALEQRVRPRDLLLVEPGFLAPSFNYYFRGSNSQIDFPFLGKRTAIPYDRTLDKVADPRIFQAVLDTLRDARNSKRRIWYITGCKWRAFPRQVPPDWIRQGVVTSDFSFMLSRSIQLRDELAALYGAPAERALPIDHSVTRESLCVELYSGEKTNQSSQ